MSKTTLAILQVIPLILFLSYICIKAFIEDRTIGILCWSITTMFVLGYFILVYVGGVS